MAVRKFSTLSIAHILFHVAGLLLIIKYLLGPDFVTNISANNVLEFIVSIFKLILVIGFYCFFLFGAKGCSSTIRALAPCLLLFIIFGQYSISFGNDANAVAQYFIGIADMLWILILICGFVYLFIHNKIVGIVFTWSTLIYGLFVLASYVTCLIIDLVNGGAFNVKDMFMSILFITSLGLIGVGSYYVSKAQQW